MAAKRKRAPGGGRKPQGAFSRLTSPLTIRMPADMRETLEKAANDRGQSVTQELLRRLQNSFDQDDAYMTSDPAMRALSFLISEVAGNFAEAYEFEAMDGRKDWWETRWGVRTFRLTLEKLLRALEPEGKLEPPHNWKELMSEYDAAEEDAELLKRSIDSWKSPEARAEYVANSIWFRLGSTYTRGPTSEDERGSYGMPEVRRDLKVTKGLKS